MKHEQNVYLTLLNKSTDLRHELIWLDKDMVAIATEDKGTRGTFIVSETLRCKSYNCFTFKVMFWAFKWLQHICLCRNHCFNCIVSPCDVITWIVYEILWNDNTVYWCITIPWDSQNGALMMASQSTFWSRYVYQYYSMPHILLTLPQMTSTFNGPLWRTKERAERNTIYQCWRS